MPFDPDDTFMGKFILDSRRPVKVLMMKTEDLTTPYFWDEELKCTVVELNYKGHGKAMFILPDQGKMEQVEASLHPGTLRKWTDSLKPRCISSGPRTIIDPCTALLMIPSVHVPQSLPYIQCSG